MLVIDIRYVKPLDQIDAVLAAHRDFLRAGYEKGFFLASGPKNPREGGVIISLLSKSEAEKVIAQDPFYQAAVAEYTLTEFDPVLHHAALEGLL